MARGETTAVDIFNRALQQQTQMYNQINQGYNTLRQQQTAQGNQVTAGYNQLLSNVMGRLQGADAAERQTAQDQYTAASGREAQALTNRGLGNTTVSSAVQRGLQHDYSKVQTDIGSRFAQLGAQYQSQLGLAGLDWQGRMVGMNSALGEGQLGSLRSFSPTYAGLYSGMAEATRQQQLLDYQRQNDLMSRVYGTAAMAGQQSQQNAARADAMGQQNRQLAFRYAALGAEQAQAQDRLGLGYAQLGQQGKQFESNLNLQYDRAAGTYGVGSPSSYSRELPSGSNRGK